MKSTRHRLAALALLAIALAVPACMELDVTTTITQDGKCVMRVDMTIARQVVEQQLLQRGQMEEAEVEDEPAPAEDEEPQKKTMTDQELTKAVQDSFNEELHSGGKPKLETVEVTKDKVRIVFTIAYESLSDMLGDSGSPWQEFGFRRTVFDKDDAGSLRLTLSAGERRERDPQMSAILKATGFKGKFTFTFPGKVLKSSLPNTQDKTTWFAVDAKDPQSFERLEKLVKESAVITSEMAGLELELPLDSEKLRTARWARRRGEESDLPITDAGPGFTAEATAITTTTLHYFPEGEKLLEAEGQRAVLGDEAGTVVHAKLYAPRGRTFLSVEQARVTKALDDKGRAIEVTGDPDAFHHMGGRGDGKETSVNIEARLGLPAPDARAIETLEAEAVATTFGKWRAHALTGLKADPEAELEIPDALPDAKLVVTKVERKKPQGEGGDADKRFEAEIDLKVTGPPAIRQLKFDLEAPGVENLSSHASRDSYQAKNKLGTRTLSVRCYAFGLEEKLDVGQLTLVVRYPDEQRRERVKFSLKGIDLF